MIRTKLEEINDISAVIKVLKEVKGKSNVCVLTTREYDGIIELLNDVKSSLVAKSDTHAEIQKIVSMLRSE